jgi:AcrR family transcriptional regulator
MVPGGTPARERVLAAAIDLIRVRGLGALGLTDITAAGGVEPVVALKLFSDMDALVEAVVDRQLAEVFDVQRPILTAMKSLRDLDIWRDIVLNATDGGMSACPLGSLIGKFDKEYERGRSALLAAFALWESHLAAALSRLRDNGELAVDADPAALATGLMAALQGGLLLAQTTRDTTQLESALDMALDRIRSHSSCPEQAIRPPA